MELNNEFVVAVPVAQAWAVLTDVERIAPCLPGAQLQEVEGDEYRGVVKVKVGPITASYKGAASFVELDEAAHRAVLKAEGRETRGQGNASATITATLVESGESTTVHVTTDLAITGKVAQFGRGVLADVSGKLLDQFVSNLEKTVLGPAEPAAKAQAEPEPEAVTEVAPDALETELAEVIAEAVEEMAAEGDGESTALADELAEEVAEVLAAEVAVELAEQAEADAASGKRAAKKGKHEDQAGDEAPAPKPRPQVRKIDHAEPEPVDLVGVAGPSLARRLVPFASAAGALFLIRIVIYALRRRKK
jgi:carbon monoxide dehydrogenase subunit G